MGQPLLIDACGSPFRWMVVFDRAAASRWASLVAMGRYKHARCFGFVASCDCWVFVDCQFAGMAVQVARGEGVRRLIAEWTSDADVLAIDARPPGPWFPLPMVCTVAVARVVGLPVRALRPDGFFRLCLKHGASVISTGTASRPRR
jgi:hypothetical protein